MAQQPNVELSPGDLPKAVLEPARPGASAFRGQGS